MTSELIKSKLAGVRSKHVTVTLLTGLARLIAFAIVFVAAVMIADFFFGLPWLARALFLLVLLAGVAHILFREIIWPITRGPDEEELALAVERERPEFASRLIAAVQFSRPDSLPPGASAALVGAMIRQTEAMAQPVDFREVIKTDRMVRFVLIAAIAAVLGFTGFLLGGGAASALLKRAFLINVPLPTKTTVDVLTKDVKAPRGDPLTISARAGGYTPSTGTLTVTYESGRTQRITMKPDDKDPALFAATLESPQDSFTYSVKLFDGESPTYRATILPRPAVTALQAAQIYPAYAGGGVVPRITSDLSLVIGSKLRLDITASKPVRVKPNEQGQTNHVQIFTDAKDAKPLWAPLTTNPQDSRKLTVDLDLPAEARAFSIHLIDDDNITSKDPAVYAVEMLPDNAPRVRITYPERREVLVTAAATHDIAFIAEDDFIVGRVTLKYKIDEGETISVPLAIAPNERAVRGVYQWPIARLSVPAGKSSLEGSAIEYWLEATDTNNISGPGKSESEHYIARVVTRAEKQAELMSRLGESLGTIKDVSENQERASSELGNLIIEGPTTRPNR